MKIYYPHVRHVLVKTKWFKLVKCLKAIQKFYSPRPVVYVNIQRTPTHVTCITPFYVESRHIGAMYTFLEPVNSKHRG